MRPASIARTFLRAIRSQRGLEDEDGDRREAFPGAGFDQPHRDREARRRGHSLEPCDLPERDVYARAASSARPARAVVERQPPRALRRLQKDPQAVEERVLAGRVVDRERVELDDRVAGTRGGVDEARRGIERRAPSRGREREGAAVGKRREQGSGGDRGAPGPRRSHGRAGQQRGARERGAQVAREEDAALERAVEQDPRGRRQGERRDQQDPRGRAPPGGPRQRPRGDRERRDRHEHGARHPGNVAQRLERQPGKGPGGLARDRVHGQGEQGRDLAHARLGARDQQQRERQRCQRVRDQQPPRSAGARHSAQPACAATTKSAV